ncbi:MAG TPA: aldolase/citrate lyase family protein [Usitatibacter sp.]|nr:aldolase/citrate lyase family protein [Usitatibacter sp.]
MTQPPGALFKDKLHRGPVTVVNPDYPAPGLVEFLGRPELGVDAVMIDLEQGSADIERVEDMARAARLGGLCSLVRIFSPEAWVIERVMLRGVDGIVVPRLEAPQQFRQVVNDVRYCFPKTYESKILVAQIESRAAYERLDEILAIEGIDVFFIGPVDLSKSMGHAGDYSGPELTATMDDICRRAQASGRASGILVKPGDPQDWRRRGVSFLYFHVNDWILLGAREFPPGVRKGG